MEGFRSMLREVLDVFRGDTPEHVFLIAEEESSRKIGETLAVTACVFVTPRPSGFGPDRLDRALDAFPSSWSERSGCTASDTELRVGGLVYTEDLTPQQFVAEQEERVRMAGHCVPPAHDVQGVTLVTRTIRVLMFPDTQHANNAACEAQGTDLAVLPIEYTVPLHQATAR